MANYNPHAPQNLGQEWVPIRNEGLVYNPFANSFERGYGFTLSQFRNVSNVRAYVNEMPEKYFEERAFTASIYKRGYEDQSGPVRSVIIPCNAGIVTGSGFSFFRASDVPTALWNPAGIQAIIYTLGQLNASNTFMFFAVNQYQNLLQNKRILGVNFLTTLDVGLLGVSDQAQMDVWMASDRFIIQGLTDGAVRYTQIVTPLTPATDVRFDRIRLGDVSRFFGVTGANNANTVYDVSQWTYTELARFEASASNRINIAFRIPAVGIQSTLGSVTVSYAALEVFYCEESRSAFGTKLFQMNDNIVPSSPIPIGAMPISIRTPAGAPVILAPDNYTVTFSESNLGDSYGANRTPDGVPIFNELRQLYEIPTVPGVEINIPFPLNDEAINQTLTVESTALIPQLSLHASGATFGTLWESHPYGRQTRGEVIDSSTLFVRQRIDTSFIAVGGGSSASYPWIRYWARRYGDTTGFLVATLNSSVAVITVEELDALDEIVDGWREVTLRFDTPATLSTATYPTIDWTPSVDQNRGNRWEILGAGAPALTGGPSNQLAQVASPHTLSIATYGQPVSGGTISESWRPQLGPYVSSASFDVISDVAFILAQDAPAVSGFGVVVTSMAVTGIGQQCGIDPCCIPTAILYNNLSWSALSAALFIPESENGGNYASTPDNAALDIVGDIDMRVDITPVSWVAPGSYQALMHKWDEPSNESYGIALQDGLIRIIWTTGGTGATLNTIDSDVAVPFLDGQRGTVRVAFDVNNGAGGKTAFFYTGPSVNGPWTQLGSAITVAGTTTIFSGSGVLELGTFDNGLITDEPIAMTIHAAQLRSSIDGTIVANPDFTTKTPGTTGFTDSAGRVWTVNGSAAIVASPPPNIPTFELQRSDAVDSTWNTIMRSSTSVTSFKDYEARVGILSSYRIRSVDVNDFPGQWSSTVSILPPSPGVSGGCVSDGHVLIFTTNEVQDGSSNLAYSSVWMDENVSEDVAFPEASFVQMQAMYDRDFFVAFRPNERGGEQFSRTVLVQAAAISPPTLGDFQSLRDMAWDNVSYICVRDEDGNRWFATVLVPSGRVLRDRRLYLAPVSVIEVTDTPSEVDPV